MQQLQELQSTARVAAARSAAITPTHQAEFSPPHEPEAAEPELRDVLAETPWSSILVPFAVGLLSIVASLLLVFKTK